MITDNGTYLYNGKKEWRDYFKGTYGHNTICLDKEDQMVNHRRFKWLKRTDARVEKWVENDKIGFVHGIQYGYKRLKVPATHHRLIFLIKDEYVVLGDYLEGLGKHEIDIGFNFDALEYSIDEEQRVDILGEKCGLTILQYNYNYFDRKFYRGDTSPIDGWRSTEYGIKEPCITMRYNNKE